jgi:hypothetical protein
MRSGDFQRASRALDDAESLTGGDERAEKRVSQWRLLQEYAREFPRHRDAALKAAAAGREYDFNGSKISVVEIDDDWFVYRGRGQNVRVPRSDMPEALVFAIVKAWFAGANQAGNSMILGAYHATRATPDLAAARAEWVEAAAQGEPTGQMLVDMLDDPVFRAVADE